MIVDFLQLGLDSSGRILACEVQYYMNAGCSMDLSFAVSIMLFYPTTLARENVSDPVPNCSRLDGLVKDRLVGLVVRRPPRERKILGSNPACAGIFWGSSRASHLKIGTPVATLPGAWRYRVSTGTGRPGVSIL